MFWDVFITRVAEKGSRSLPKFVYAAYLLLLAEIEQCGPDRTGWKHYGRIRGGGDCHHCHLREGRPTYVAVQRVLSRRECIVEVTYAGTHERADYKRRC